MQETSDKQLQGIPDCMNALYTAGTHHPCQFTIKFLDDTSEAPTGQVEEPPTPLHCFPVPTRVLILARFCQIPVMIMP